MQAWPQTIVDVVLSSNSIAVLEAGAFAHMAALRTVDLGYNLLTAIDAVRAVWNVRMRVSYLLIGLFHN